MNLDKLHEHYELLEDIGFITNCPPRNDLMVYHDTIHHYCEKLNQLALSEGVYIDPPFESIHLNEPAGDYIAIFKNEEQYKNEALSIVNGYADKVATETDVGREW